MSKTLILVVAISLFIPICLASGADWYKASQQSPRSHGHGIRIDFRSYNDEDLAKKFAPIVYFDKGEEYFPSSIGEFLKHVKMIQKDGTLVQNNPTIDSIKRGEESYFLVSKEKLKCASCKNLSFLKGQSSLAVPAYAIVRRQEDFVDIIFWFFYPYNRGKRVCIGIAGRKVCRRFGRIRKLCFKLVGQCVGKFATFGHHVGDWEHISIRLSTNGPSLLALSAHNFGGIYDYNSKENNFRRKNNNRWDIVKLRGTHPIVFSAKGSHGLWHKSGRHVYKRLCNGAQLFDDTSKGRKWQTSKDLKVFSWQKSGDYDNVFKPLSFLGRWGNREKGCKVIKKLSGQCVLNGGPTGPRHKSSMENIQPLSKRENVEIDGVADSRDIVASQFKNDDDVREKDVIDKDGLTEKAIKEFSDTDGNVSNDVSSEDEHLIEKRGWGRRRRRRSRRRRRIRFRIRRKGLRRFVKRVRRFGKRVARFGKRLGRRLGRAIIKRAKKIAKKMLKAFCNL